MRNKKIYAPKSKEVCMFEATVKEVADNSVTLTFNGYDKQIKKWVKDQDIVIDKSDVDMSGIEKGVTVLVCGSQKEPKLNKGETFYRMNDIELFKSKDELQKMSFNKPVLENFNVYMKDGAVKKIPTAIITGRLIESKPIENENGPLWICKVQDKESPDRYSQFVIRADKYKTAITQADKDKIKEDGEKAGKTIKEIDKEIADFKLSPMEALERQVRSLGIPTEPIAMSDAKHPDITLKSNNFVSTENWSPCKAIPEEYNEEVEGVKLRAKILYPDPLNKNLNMVINSFEVISIDIDAPQKGRNNPAQSISVEDFMNGNFKSDASVREEAATEASNEQEPEVENDEQEEVIDWS